MSILKSLQTYLTQYDGMELRNINEILTDTVESDGGYALAPTGNSMAAVDILGNKVYTNNYVFYAKESAVHEADRSDNYDFLENLTEWLEDRNEAEDLPILPGKYEAIEIVPTNAMLFDIGEDGSALYQVQIQLKIRKGAKTDG